MSAIVSAAIALSLQLVLLVPLLLLIRRGRRRAMLGLYLIGATTLALVVIVPLQRPSVFPEALTAQTIPEAQCRRLLELGEEAGIVSTGTNGQPVLIEGESLAALPAQVREALQACIVPDTPAEAEAGAALPAF